MNDCRNNNLKYNCGSKTNARCVGYDGYLPEYSKLEDCVTIEETTEELYENQEKIYESIDLSNLGKNCITYNKKDEKLKVKEALFTIETEICKLKNQDEESNAIDISKLDLKCLKDPCNNNINNINQLLQVLINEVCTLK